MEVSLFTEKLNKVDGNVYVIEEEVHLTGGVYEAPLAHDNINMATLAVFTGPKLTGERLETYAVSTPSLTPWKRVIRVYADAEIVYISYETDGDTVEAEDINLVQGAVVRTQKAVTKEEVRAQEAETVLTNRLQEESGRAMEEETRLGGRIDTETRRAQEAETVLTEDIAAEAARAQAAEQVITDDLGTETARAQEAEKTLTDNLIAEITRSRGAETTLTDNLSAETVRAKTAEKTNADNLSSEITRAKEKETELQGNIDAHTSSVAGEIQELKAADTALDEKKANIVDVNQELGNRYTKDQVFTKQEVLQKIEDLIGSAPDTLDTFREIADALGNDPNFAATIMNKLSEKVDKVAGKQLTSNDYSDSEKAVVADVNAKKHSHSNKTILDQITQASLDSWDGKAGTAVATQTVNGLMAASDKKKLDGVAEGANHYVHPTSAGNKHIPSGGASGQILRWSADGTAVWGTDNNTAYSVFKAATASADGGTGLVPAPAAGEQINYLRADGTWQMPPNTSYTHPDSGVTAGTYRSVTVNVQGHVIAGTNPTTLSGYGITDAAAKNHNHDSTYLHKGPLTWNDLMGV